MHVFEEIDVESKREVHWVDMRCKEELGDLVLKLKLKILGRWEEVCAEPMLQIEHLQMRGQTQR